jgi:hypothetical protein
MPDIYKNPRENHKSRPHKEEKKLESRQVFLDWTPAISYPLIDRVLCDVPGRSRKQDSSWPLSLAPASNAKRYNEGKQAKFSSPHQNFIHHLRWQIH